MDGPTLMIYTSYGVFMRKELSFGVIIIIIIKFL